MMRILPTLVLFIVFGTVWSFLLYLISSGNFLEYNALVQIYRWRTPNFLSPEVNSMMDDSRSRELEDINSLVDSSQDDPRIISFIQNEESFLRPPSQQSYNLNREDKDPSMGQGQFIRKLFSKTGQPGFFVECGALDGETRSNTLYLEKNLGWKGLLIEANPDNFAVLLKKHRKAWVSNSCLATKPNPHKVRFMKNFNVGKIVKEQVSKDETKKQNAKSKLVVAQCFPLFSLLSAMNVSTVDYFSLDVEGAEFKVLNHIPFDKIFIKALSVEFAHVPEGKKKMKEFMSSKGYDVVKVVTKVHGYANDFIFLHRSLKALLPATTKKPKRN